ncbi:MAG: hypothetical protein LUF29_08560 [Oscillospiraceae bacterium]|nr:hypothetical protein [Oscillospiraceae bacterium]
MEEAIMSLIDLFSTQFTKLTVTTETDSLGNTLTSLSDDVTFTGALVLDSSSESDSRLVRKYTLTVSPEVDLGYGDIFRRDSDGEVFEITGEDTGESPEMATFSFRQFIVKDYEGSTTVSGSLVITDGSSTVILSLGTDYTITKSRIGSTATASDGTTVLDVIGCKVTLSVSDAELSREMASALVGMIEASPFLSVTYPDISGSVTTDFLFDIPKLEAREFDSDGVCTWCAVTLTATGKEVE